LKRIAVVDVDNCLSHFEPAATKPFLQNKKPGELLNYYSEEVYYPTHRPVLGAKLAVTTLVALDFEVLALTARRASIDLLTRGWLDLHFGGLISEVFYESEFAAASTAHYPSHKGIAASALGAVVLIDDTLAHVLAATDEGIRLPILFGNPPSGGGIILPPPAVHAPDWNLAIQLIRREFRL
jgi:hypothetical protein